MSFRTTMAEAKETGDRPNDKALAELREFLGFLGSLWGILAGVTVFFPLSNMLFIVLPILPGAERLSTVLATLFSLFAIFFVFVLRNADFSYESEGQDIASFVVGAIISLACGIIVLVAYSYIYLNPLASGLDPVLYAGVFGFFTAAFTLLALAEYVHNQLSERRIRQRSGEEGRGGDDVDGLLDQLRRMDNP